MNFKASICVVVCLQHKRLVCIDKIKPDDGMGWLDNAQGLHLWNSLPIMIYTRGHIWHLCLISLSREVRAVVSLPRNTDSFTCSDAQRNTPHCLFMRRHDHEQRGVRCILCSTRNISMTTKNCPSASGVVELYLWTISLWDNVSEVCLFTACNKTSCL